MGYEIVYCSECQVRLSGADFEKGRAFRIRDAVVCADCARKLLPTLSPEDRSKVAGKSQTPPSGTRIPVSPAGPRPGSTSRLKPVPARPSTHRIAPEEESEEVGETPPSKKKIAWLAGAAGGALLLVVLLVFALSGRKRADESSGLEPRKPGEAAAAGEAAVQKARSFCSSNPTDFDGQVAAWEDAVRLAEGTPHHERARRELEELRARQNTSMDQTWAGFDNDLKGMIDREEFKSAQDLCDRVALHFNARTWRERVGAVLKEIRERPAALFAQVKEKAVEARARGDSEEITRLRRRVERWGIGNFLSEFDTAYVVRPLPPPAAPPAPPPAADPPAAAPQPPPPPPPSIPPALAAYRERWEKAMRMAWAWDFTAAASEIANVSRAVDDPGARKEAAADLEAANLMDAAHAEALKILAGWPAGRKLSLKFREERGTARRFEGAVLLTRPHRIVLSGEGETVAVEFGEIAGSSIAELFLSRPDRKPESDGRIAALLCLLDGDEEAARKYVPGPGTAVPERYWELARKLAAERDGADPEAARREAEARKIFYEVVRNLAVPGRVGEGLQKADRLLDDFAGTVFVRRNRGFLSSQKDAGREYFFLPSDMLPSGTFKAGKSPKGMDALIAGEDMVSKNNCVEFEFYAMPGAEYRCWALLGGCCRENFLYFLQATDLAMPDPKNPRQTVQAEPDGNYALPLKISIAYLKPSHASHGGKKEPARFEWIPIPLPKYSSPGKKVVRILAEVKGSAVARVLVTSLRKELPKDAEVGELERTRSEEISMGLTGKLPTGKILREWWSGIGGHRVDDLRGRLRQKPSGSGLLESFDAPADREDNYGTRIIGFVHPPRTGSYVFWIASDDNGELWLSTDEDPANKRLIASVPEWTGRNEWGKFASQKSEPIRLEAGRRYYIEALQKEGVGGDHLSVGWQLPDGTQERPIPGHRLSDK